MTNGTLIQYFEWELPDDGKHWQNLAADAKHLSDVGFTHVWMPPATKGTGTNDVGYGIYDLYDLGEFDQKGNVRTKYGTKDDYLTAIKALHDIGLSAIADVVLNHKAGADESEEFTVYKVDPNNRQQKISDEMTIEGWTKFTFPGRCDTYSDFKWDWTHFTGVDFDQKSGESGIYMIKGIEKGWADNDEVDSELGNYDYLMNADIDYAHPDVRDHVLGWVKWFIHETGVDGFRLDAIKHVEDDFMLDVVRTAREVNENFYAIGEYWKDSYRDLETYMTETKFQFDLFDVALHHNFEQASKAGNQFDMSTLLADTLMVKNPTKAVTFVDNHDSQPGQALESWVEPWFKPMAYALILLHENGLPCVFYGDYYGINGNDDINGMSETLDKLLALRRERAYGVQHNYFDHYNCVGFTREGNEEHGDGLALVMTNGDASYKDMYVGEHHAGEVWVDHMGNQEEEAVIGDDGNARFTCSAGSYAVWSKK